MNLTIETIQAGLNCTHYPSELQLTDKKLFHIKNLNLN